MPLNGTIIQLNSSLAVSTSGEILTHYNRDSHIGYPRNWCRGKIEKELDNLDDPILLAYRA